MSKKKNSTDKGVPISAMIDVVFLLLIYFIVTIKTTIDQAWVAVSLPGTGPTHGTPKQSVDVFVQSGEYVYQNNTKNLAQLEAVFKSLKELNDEDVVINIKVSLKARHNKLVDLLDLLSKVGLKNFNLHSLKDPLSL